MIEQLNQKFAIGNSLKFLPHADGLIQGIIETPICTGSFFLLGGHVSAYQPKSQQHPVLFMSRDAIYTVGKPIRGGVPVCFPWFGPNASDATAPAHGLVRTELWDVVEAKQTGASIVVRLQRELPNYRLDYRIEFGASLKMQMSITNTSDQTQQCELALHTYFQIGELSKVSITGLESIAFRDKLTGTIEPAAGIPIAFAAETDRVYMGKVAEIELHDPAWNRIIRLVPENSQSTVVWNPWIEKSKRLNDFADDEYLQMCCIETAKVHPDELSINPGQSAVVGVQVQAQDKSILPK